MKKKIFQKTLFIVGMLAFINGYAADNDDDYVNCDDYKSTFQGHSAPKGKINKGYNHPARIDVRNSWDYFISGSYIYWQPRQDGLELAREISAPEVEGWTVENDTLVHMDFDYHSGFKVGTGANFERDDWSLEFEYTRLYTIDHKNRTLSSDPLDLLLHYLMPFWNAVTLTQDIGTGDGTFYAKARWKLHFNILDGILARSHYVGTKLSFKPYIGLRAGWIHQRYRANYTYSHEYVEDYYNIYLRSHYKSQSWLLGARIGLDTNWHFGEGFRLFGDTAASLFYQRFKTNVNTIRDENEEADVAFSNYTMKEKEGYLNPNFEIALGLGWGSYFCDDNWHIDLSAAYEFHIFWDQNMMRKLLDYNNYAADPTPGDLILHGLTVSLRLDF
jgi:hypothetical protein